MLTVEKYNFKGKKAIVRVDFNVPLDKKTFQVTDDTRIRGALPTINKILSDGGCAILMSHLGRPDGVPQDKYSLKHVIPAFEKLVEKPVKFADDCIGESAKGMDRYQGAEDGLHPFGNGSSICRNSQTDGYDHCNKVQHKYR